MSREELRHELVKAFERKEALAYHHPPDISRLCGCRVCKKNEKKLHLANAQYEVLLLTFVRDIWNNG